MTPVCYAHMEIVLNDRKVLNGWALFDWANSSYALVISVAIFPIFFIDQTNDYISFGNLEISNSSLYAFSISFAYLIITILLPVLSGIADYTGRRMFFLKLFSTIGSMACVSLFFFNGMPQLFIGLAGFILATIGFDGGKVFYNSYLPIICSKDQYDRVSAKGFSYGYIGSVILLCTNLAIIKNPNWFGIPEGDTLAVRISFLMVGLWWFGFAQISFSRLPPDTKGIAISHVITRGIQEIRKVWNELKPQKNIKRFLFSFLFYSAGVQTILYLASAFAEKELHFETSELIIVILLLQLVAIGGAYFFAFISGIKGNKYSLISMLLIWIAICFLAYYVQEKLQFYLIAGLVGLVMGGIQSMSRSTYSKLITDNTTDSTSYFSFYEILEKIAIMVGTFSFGFIEQITGGMRNSILLLGSYFLIGIVILATVKIQSKEAIDQLANS